MREEKKNSEEIVVDGRNISKMGAEELIKFILKSVDQLLESKRRRSFEEEERDIFFRQLESARSALLKANAEFLTKKRNIQTTQEGHHLELKVHRQRANLLKYQLNKELENEDRILEEERQQNAEQTSRQQQEILSDYKRIQRKTADERRTFEQNMKELRLKLDVEGKEIRKKYVDALADRQEYFRVEREEALEEAEIDLRTYSCKADQERLEKRSQLQLNFEKKFHDVKDHFQELTNENLSMIEELKSQCRKMKEDVKKLVFRLKEIQNEKRHSGDPMRLRQQHLQNLKKKVQLVQKDEEALSRVTKELVSLETERVALKQDIHKTKEEFKKKQQEIPQILHAIEETRTNYIPASLEARHMIGAEANLIHQKTSQMAVELHQLKKEPQNPTTEADINKHQYLNQTKSFPQKHLDNLTVKKAPKHRSQNEYLRHKTTPYKQPDTFQNSSIYPWKKTIDPNSMECDGVLAAEPAEITQTTVETLSGDCHSKLEPKIH